MSSFEKINYSLRPAKSIERKMLCEAFQRLSQFKKLKSYFYIGFGSIYFSDFQLIHRTLNISRMKSIEQETSKKDRFQFNLPFRCIDLLMGHSNDMLDRLPWDELMIMWLDYDGGLESSVLKDVQKFFTQAKPGSLFLVSLNAHPAKILISDEEDSEEETTRLDTLKKAVGAENVEASWRERDFGGWGTGKIYRSIIQNKIDETLAARNGVIETDKLIYQQLFNFNYQDGVRMQTVGGILYDEGQKPQFSSCDFDDLEFIRKDTEPYQIKVPKLTFREIHHLDSKLPANSSNSIKIPGVPQKDIDAYREIYRFFPKFAETEF